MKIQVKHSNSLHSGNDLSFGQGHAGHDTVKQPRQRDTSRFVNTIIFVLLSVFAIVLFLFAVGHTDQDEAGEQQVQPTTTKETVQPKLSPEDAASLKGQGFDPNSFQTTDQQQQQPQVKGIAYIGSFWGMTNFAIPSDYIVSMKNGSVKFQINGQKFDYSGHYAVMLNAPRKHSNPLLGFGTAETAKLVIMDDFGGETYPLPGATIWEKSNGFIDFDAMGKEWIYSGSYSIQK